MCDEKELSLEDEDAVIDVLTSTLQQYMSHNHASDHIVTIITSYIFCSEYYFRRDCHFIEAIYSALWITLYLHKSKFCRNLFKLTCPIYGPLFERYVCNVLSCTQSTDAKPPNKRRLSAWIDTECKTDTFTNSRSANMANHSCFLMMTYFEESRQSITPWLVQWNYDINGMPFIRVIAKIVSYPADWNYVNLSYSHPDTVSVIFYTSMEQHTIEYRVTAPHDENEYKEQRVSIVKFADNLNYPWLMFGSAATKILTHSDVLLLFGDACSPLLRDDGNALDEHCEYFVTRSCKDFEEMTDQGRFWTFPRDHISIFQIAESGSRPNRKLHANSGNPQHAVNVRVTAQFPIFGMFEDDKVQRNILDVTVSNQWSAKFQRKYGVKTHDRAFLVLYTEINHYVARAKTELYASYIGVQGGKVSMLKRTRLASSETLTKFLVGRGSYQTVQNDWMCTLIGIDEHNHEVRHQLRLTEMLELFYYQRVKRNENVQEVSSRYECRGLKYFQRALKEEMEIQRENEPAGLGQAVWNQVVASRHLIFTTLVGAYVGYRISRALRNGQWTFRMKFGLSMF